MIEQLQATLGDAYTLERELGGGGMSRVFVALERRLGRRVVVKVLSNDVAASVSTERFEREIRVAASLSQANIVPVLTAGETNGLPYYTMPLVEGESLRARLAKPGQLSVPEVVSILRDVARALAYAHERGVVHRDIKPDNVLLSGGTAVVTDFGIAKAISAARTESANATLTQVGTSIGTPAYMSPEQAAGDPDIDHRADIYALGCMAYELLTGQTPFHDRSIQQIIVAHLVEEPEPLTHRRPDIPDALRQLVEQCLAKSADARPGSANEIIARLAAVGTGEITVPAATGADTQLVATAGGLSEDTERHGSRSGGKGLRRALALYVVACAAVALLTMAAMTLLGLPDWVPMGSAVVMALGLPAILFTGFVLRAHGSESWIAARAIRHVSWRRAGLGGAVALLALVLLVAGYMMLRAFGIGPAGSLIGAGRVRPAERVLIAEFDVASRDTLLSTALAEAVRTELGQSRVITIVPTSAVADALVRMNRPSATRLDLSLAKELAQREGIKAIVHGGLTSLGSGFLVALGLVETDTGNELVSFRASVAGPGELISALDGLARRLRGKVGESLRAVRSSPPLEQVTTTSLPALRKYAEGARAEDMEEDHPKAIRLLREATRLDTTFAMAYRKLAAALNNAQAPDSLLMAASARAYALRERLTEPERLLTDGFYFEFGPGRDLAKASRAYEALLEIDSTSAAALNNLGTIYLFRREFAQAVQLYRRAAASPGGGLVDAGNVGRALAYLGDVAGTDSVATAIYRQFRSDVYVMDLTTRVALARGLSDSAQKLIDWGLRHRDAAVRAKAMVYRADLSLMRGQLADAVEWMGRISTIESAIGMDADPSTPVFTSAWADIRLRGRPERALRAVDAELARRRPQANDVEHFPYATGGILYAMGGRTSRAREILREWRAATRDTSVLRNRSWVFELLVAEIALAEGRPLDALRAFQHSDSLSLEPDRLGLYVNLGRAFDAAGLSDSTIFYLERYLSTGSYTRVGASEGFTGFPSGDSTDPLYLALTLKRLGELYEAKGDRQKAITRYSAFVELWKNADPDLQPTVALVRKRLAALETSGGR